MNRYGMYLLAITCSAIFAIMGTSTNLAGPGRITSLQSAQKQSAQNQDQPFHAEITTTSTFTPSSNPCVTYEDSVGRGVMSIGADSMDVSYQALDEPLRRVPCGLVEPGRGAEFVGWHFFCPVNDCRAASGDKLVAHIHVTFDRLQPDGSRIFNGTFTFCCGTLTGKFAGAEGDGNFVATFPPVGSPDQNTGKVVYDGEITLQSSSNNGQRSS